LRLYQTLKGDETNMPRYKYDSARAWLIERVDEMVREDKAAQLSYFLRPVLLGLSEDEIQDYYQRDMDEDGFFDDLDARPEGYRVHHDIDGWYVVEPDEEEPEDGYSLGFDGREHYATEEAAKEAAHA
jgi:hypothetical protein